MSESEVISASNPQRASLASHARRLVAAAFILTLAGCGIYNAWKEHDSGSRLIALAPDLSAAVTYGFGFFWCLPDVIGAMRHSHERTLWQRWSDFSRLAATFAVTILVIALVWAAIENRNNLRIASILVFSLIFAAFFLAAAVMASEGYLANTMERGTATLGAGWKAGARKLVGRLGSPIVRWLSARRALVIGGSLVLASLLLPMDWALFSASPWAFFSVPPKGYELVFGAAAKWDTTYSDHLVFIDKQLARWIYRFDLALAATCLVLVLMGKRGDRLLRRRLLAIVAGVLVLHELGDRLISAAFLSDSLPEPLAFAVATVAWIISVVLWLWRARGAQQEWRSTRLALMVLLLPVVFVIPPRRDGKAGKARDWQCRSHKFAKWQRSGNIRGRGPNCFNPVNAPFTVI